MTSETSERARYYREIARAFLDRRGAPLFLSPKDLELIALWEREGIPLAVVLEGISRSFETLSGRPAPSGRVSSLSFCQNEIRKAFAVRRGRRVGKAAAGVPRETKQDRSRRAVEEFLARPAAGSPADLADIFRRAGVLLSGEVVDEDALERLDEEVDGTLAASAAGEDGRGPDPGPKRSSPAADRARRIRHLREKYRVPYVSVYYY